MSRSCDTCRIDQPSWRRSCSIRPWKASLAWASSPAWASSKSKSRRGRARQKANNTRFNWPPESSLRRWEASLWQPVFAMARSAATVSDRPVRAPALPREAWREAIVDAVLPLLMSRGASVTTLHLVAHGRAGAFRLGNRWISTASLVAAAGELALWKLERIALWSCHTAADPGFIATLAELTGSRVLASSAVINSHEAQTITSPGGETLQLQALFSEPAISTWAGSLVNEYTLTNQQLEIGRAHV